jgi:uncharacterized cupredoxin-like copper-binding protein
MDKHTALNHSNNFSIQVVHRMKTLSKIALVLMSVVAVSAQAAITDGQVVKVKLWDQGSSMGISTDSPTAKAGKVTFDVENDSKSLVHEMLVVKVAGYNDSLPYDEKSARIFEDRVADYGEVSELEPHQSGTLAVNLKPGKYMLICNMPGHYKSKMYTNLLVTP